MKRILIICTLVLIFVSNGLAKNSDTELFLLPEQGFLRVDAHLLLNTNQAQLNFKLFPNVQITAIWTENLASYSLERKSNYTLITVELEAKHEEPFWLDLSYEGFLDGYQENHQNLDQSLLWFPLFDEPLSNLQIKMTLPKDHLPIINLETTIQELSAFSIFSWQVFDSNYPIILFNEHQVSKEELKDTELAEAEVSTPTSEPELNQLDTTLEINEPKLPESTSYDFINNPLLESWVNQLITAIHKQNLIWLDQHLAIQDYNKLALIQFLINLRIDTSDWEVTEIFDGNYQVTLFTQEQNTGARLGVVFDVKPDENKWEIIKLKLMGLYP